MAKRGDAVRFRSISGIVYDAILMGEVHNGRAMIEVAVTAYAPLPLRNVLWSDAPSEATFTAWPKEA